MRSGRAGREARRSALRRIRRSAANLLLLRLKHSRDPRPALPRRIAPTGRAQRSAHSRIAEPKRKDDPPLAR